MMRHSMTALGALTLGSLAFGCSHPRMPASHCALPSHEAVSAPLVVGAARVDVTPPPGASMFGHGPGAGVGVGYWTRLWCRAFYFQSAQAPEDGFAIVACDLPNISTILHRSVAKRTQPSIRAARLMITATHTHAGPGHYTESKNLGGMGSALFPGFDPKMVDFLADHIASAVKEARDNARPARLRWVTRDVWGLTRNRSLAPYLANRPPARWSVPASYSSQGDAYEAIDPTLRVLQIQAVDDAGGPLDEVGSLSFFAMHPTVIGNENRFFGGDVHGVVTRQVEAARASGSVHAILNTNEGDISPAWVEGTASEAIRFGQKLGSDIVAALNTASDDGAAASQQNVLWQDRPALGVRYLEEHLPNAAFFLHPGGVAKHLCPEPELGVGAVRGAKDHPSLFQDILPTVDPDADPSRVHCQAPKRQFLGRLQTFANGSGAFPEDVPLGLVRVDDTWISFVPAELTITAGHRVNEAVLEIARTEMLARTVRGANGVPVRTVPTADAVVAGLANGYIQYVATPEEYALQQYEGASTLYGPDTAVLLAQRFRFLALHLAHPATSGHPTGYTDAFVDEASDFAYHTGPHRERFWRKSQDVPLDELGSQRRAEGICRIPSKNQPAFCAQWIDGGPAAVALDGRTYVEVAGCSGSACTPVSTPINDQGVEFHTRVHDRVGDAWRWSTVFHPSAATWARLAAMDRAIIRVRGTERVGSIDLPTLVDARPCPEQLLLTVCRAPFR